MFVDEKPQGEVTEAPARIERLSQAIRVGARIRQQCFGSYYIYGGSCAIGAAAEALNIGSGFWETFNRLFGLDERTWEKIIRLNDEFKMSREEIADWLEACGL